MTIQELLATRLAAYLTVGLILSGLAIAASGCGADESTSEMSGAIETKDPERTFAPLVELPAGERYRPMSARWFIERSRLAVAEDRSCADRTIAVGHMLPELHDDITDWIFPRGLGRGPQYYRGALDADCELAAGPVFATNQLTRPHDSGSGRPTVVRPAVGYYLDLEDSARAGPRSAGPAPVYVERRDEGDGRVRLTYWMLYGMHLGGRARLPAHEGDWERVDVLLDEADGGYRPQSVQLGLDGGVADPAATRELTWSATPRSGGTHPRLVSEAGTHRLLPATDSCTDCLPWRTWGALSDARAQPWYGYGGAWGEVGSSDATTGPLGPHGHWPPPDDALG